MKHKYRSLAILILILSLLSPRLIFWINDQFFTKREVEWNSQVVQDLRIQYPILESIYEYYYQYHTSDVEMYAYELNNLSMYKEPMQNQLTSLQEKYTTAINELLVQDILPYEILDLERNDEFMVNFGTIQMSEQEQYEFYKLEQYFQVEASLIKSASYVLDTKSNSIIQASFTTPLVKTLQEEDFEAILWNYITYLGLEDIEDWNYRNGTFESYEAKLQVSATLSIFSLTFEFGAAPLGQRFNYNYMMR